MKICYIIDAHTVLSQRIAESFADSGAKILILCSIAKYPNSHGNIEIKELGVSKKKLKIPYMEHLDHVMKIKSEIADFVPDIVHGHYMTTAASHVIAVDRKYPVVLSAWGSDVLFDLKVKHHEMLIKRACKRADRITSVAGHVTRRLEEMGVRSDKITTFPFGVDTALFNPDVSAVELRNKIGIGEDEKVVISTRMFEPVYDLGTLLDAVPLLISKHKKVRVVLVGTGSLEDELKSKARSLDIEDSVLFTGFVAHEKLAEYLNLADVYVSTSVSDGASVSMLEAMACRVFPVVTDIPANTDWIENKINGLLFKTGDPQGLAAKLEDALGRPKLRRSATSSNYNKVIDKANWNSNMGELERIYDELIGTKG